MPAIEHITVQGFKSIKHLEELRLRPINVLIGANGSGKSNFIGVFAFLRVIREGKLQDYVARAGGADRILHFGSKITQELRIHIAFKDESSQDESEYEIVLSATEADRLYPRKETIFFGDVVNYKKKSADLTSTSSADFKSFLAGPIREWSRVGDTLEAGIGHPAAGRTVQYLRDHLENCRVYHFHDTGPSSPIKRTADLHDNRFLRPDGANLAAFLYFLRERCQIEYRMIRDTVRLAAPFFDDFRLEPLALNEDTILLEWQHKNSDTYFNAAALSDGTLRFIALVTLFMQPVNLRPSVILLDEPELGLHPYAMTLLASLVKQASVETQIILATQSPILLNYFEPESVLVADRVKGRTRFTRLDSEQLAAWLDDYSLGQLWKKTSSVAGQPMSIDRGGVHLAPRLRVHVEGPTEEAFIRDVLAPHLYNRGYANIWSTTFGDPNQNGGGITSWKVARREILSNLKKDTDCFATTMVDYYGLPSDWTNGVTAIPTVSGRA